MRLNEKKNMLVRRAVLIWSNLDGTGEKTRWCVVFHDG